MSSNLTPSLPPGSHRNAAAHAVDALSGASPAAALTARGQSESDSQAFARWMAQYSQAQTTPAFTPQPVKSPSAPSPLQQSAQKAHQPQARHVDMNVGKPAAPDAHAEAAKPQAPPRPVAKAVAKPSGPKAPEAPRQEAKADQANKQAATQTGEGSDGSSDGQAVVFSTSNGEATAYVKELQPPAHVTAGDPAAMLAWLATLAQANGGVQDKAAAEVTGTSASGAGASGGLAGLGGETGGRLSQPSWAVQSALQEQGLGGQGEGKEGASNGDGEREGALSLEALGLSSTQDNSTVHDAATFGALMSQALTRSPEGLEPQASTHHTGTLPTPLSSPEFAQALSDKVGLWVTGAAQDGPMTAELRLNPEEMGPVHIRIELDGQTAHVDFAAQALETRQAIEASLPLLSEALSQTGLSLSGGGVSDQPQRQAWADADSQARDQASAGQTRGGRASVNGPAGLNPQELTGAQPPARLPRGRAGGLDLYA